MIDDFDIDSILGSDKNLINRVELGNLLVDTMIPTVVEEMPHGGRGVGDLGIAPDIKALIGVVSNMDNPTNAARAFGVTQPSARNYSLGNSSQGVKDDDLFKKVNEGRAQIADVAMEKMLASLGVITDEKLEATSAIGASQIAANLSRVMEKVLPAEGGNGVNVSVVFYAPRQKDESDYEVINVTPSRE